MKKEKQVKAYQRRSKTGKIVTVKAHKAKYDAADDIKATIKKGGAGEELLHRKEEQPQLEVAGITPEDYEVWYEWDQAGEPDNPTAIKVENALIQKMGKRAYKRLFNDIFDTYKEGNFREHYTELAKQYPSPRKYVPTEAQKLQERVDKLDSQIDTLSRRVLFGQNNEKEVKEMERTIKELKTQRDKIAPKKSTPEVKPVGRVTLYDEKGKEIGSTLDTPEHIAYALYMYPQQIHTVKTSSGRTTLASTYRDSISKAYDNTELGESLSMNVRRKRLSRVEEINRERQLLNARIVAARKEAGLRYDQTNPFIGRLEKKFARLSEELSSLKK